MDIKIILFIFCICFLIIYNYNYPSIEPFYNNDDKQRIYTIMLKKISQIFNKDNVHFFYHPVHVWVISEKINLLILIMILI